MIALYALLLQAFLGHAAPAPAFDPVGGVLCVDHGGGAPDGGAARADCHPCCTAVHAGTLAPPVPVASEAPRPSDARSRLAWRPGAARLKTGPPVRVGTARGPPAA